MRNYLQIFVLAAVSLLFLLFLGPLLDHHYAERQPDHAHIYLGQFAPDHIHPFQAPHTHFYTPEANDGTSASALSSDETPSDIVYLASYDGMGQVFTQLTVPSIHLALNFPAPEDHYFAFDAAGDDSFYQNAFIAPPEKPPRA